MKLVTGGAGFIGSHLCEALNGTDDVRVMDNQSVGHQNVAFLKDLGIHTDPSDIRSLDAVIQNAYGCDTVFHLAAMNRAARSIENPLEANAINVDGTLNVLEACRKCDVEKLVLASSSSVYGSSQMPNTEEQPLRPLHPYGVGKMAAEQYARVYHDVYGLDTVILRYVSVYGPRQRGDIACAAVVPKFIEQIYENKPVTLFGDGTQTRHFTYVKDTVAMTLAAASSPNAKNQVFNVATNVAHSVNDIIHTLSRISQKNVSIQHLPKNKADPDHNPIDTQKIRRMLDIPPCHSLEAGLKEMVAWYTNEAIL